MSARVSGFASSRLTTRAAERQSRLGSRVRSRNAVTSHGTRIVSAAAWTSASVMSARAAVYPVMTASGTSTSGTGVGVGTGVGEGAAVGLPTGPTARRGWARLVAQAGAQEDRHADEDERLAAA